MFQFLTTNVTNMLFHDRDLRIPAIFVGAIRESPLHLGLYFQICVSPNYIILQMAARFNIKIENEKKIR